MNIVISACLLGRNCKYNGGNNRSERIIALLQGQHLIPVCPEMQAGLGAPRPPVELLAGRIVDQAGHDLDACYREGVRQTMAQLAGQPVDLAILQSRSPTCGVRQIYDGSFSRRLKDGQGILAGALAQAGVRLLDRAELEQAAGDGAPLALCLKRLDDPAAD